MAWWRQDVLAGGGDRNGGKKKSIALRATCTLVVGGKEVAKNKNDKSLHLEQQQPTINKHERGRGWTMDNSDGL